MTFFITQNDYFNEVPVSQHVDFQWLGNLIDVVQKRWLPKCLGASFYAELVSQIDSNTLTVDNNSLLVDHIKPMLCWYLHAQALPFLRARVENKGVMVNKDETSDAISGAGLSQLKFEAENIADEKRLQMVEFLDQHQDLYPLYQIEKCQSGNCHKSNSQIYTNITPRRRG